jgi:hypothetical protein
MPILVAPAFGAAFTSVFFIQRISCLAIIFVCRDRIWVFYGLLQIIVLVKIHRNSVIAKPNQKLPMLASTLYCFRTGNELKKIAETLKARCRGFCIAEKRYTRRIAANDGGGGSGEGSNSHKRHACPIDLCI